MTKIDFFSNAPNRLDYVVRVLKKIQTLQQKAVVFADINTINHLSDALWALDGFHAHDIHHQSDVEFLCAHATLISTFSENLPHHDVLINLTDTLPVFFASFLRLIEIVPNDETPRNAARERWSYYKSKGYNIHHHNIDQS